MREESLAIDCYQVQSSLNRGNQEITEGMLFEGALRSLKAKLDVITLKVQLDTIMHGTEQKRDVNAFNPNHIICDLCGDYHATHICRQAQNVNYFNEFEHCNPYFEQYGPNWGSFYA